MGERGNTLCYTRKPRHKLNWHSSYMFSQLTFTHCCLNIKHWNTSGETYLLMLLENTQNLTKQWKPSRKAGEGFSIVNLIFRKKWRDLAYHWMSYILTDSRNLANEGSGSQNCSQKCLKLSKWVRLKGSIYAKYTNFCKTSVYENQNVIHSALII